MWYKTDDGKTRYSPVGALHIAQSSGGSKKDIQCLWCSPFFEAFGLPESKIAPWILSWLSQWLFVGTVVSGRLNEAPYRLACCRRLKLPFWGNCPGDKTLASACAAAFAEQPREILKTSWSVFDHSWFRRREQQTPQWPCPEEGFAPHLCVQTVLHQVTANFWICTPIVLTNVKYKIKMVSAVKCSFGVASLC